MALNSRNPIDPRWVAHNRLVIRGLQLAQVEIYNPVLDEQSYNATTGVWTSNPEPVYTGRARVQPINSVNEVNDNFNPTLVKSVRVQISYNKNEITGATDAMPDIRPNFKMRVTSSPNNESLVNFLYTITDVLNSSNAWERTLICKVDTEVDPNFTGA